MFVGSVAETSFIPATSKTSSVTLQVIPVPRRILQILLKCPMFSVSGYWVLPGLFRLALSATQGLCSRLVLCATQGLCSWLVLSATKGLCNRLVLCATQRLWSQLVLLKQWDYRGSDANCVAFTRVVDMQMTQRRLRMREVGKKKSSRVNY